MYFFRFVLDLKKSDFTHFPTAKLIKAKRFTPPEPLNDVKPTSFNDLLTINQ